ncbi:MAG: hypothetical protein M1546_08300 [Chloroflexi bacterium]|nr:hypothetical protein [Chloroflexota bacterium]
MKSHISRSFREQYRRLPAEVRQQARKVYRQWLRDPFQPSLQFKRVGLHEPVYSVRIGLHWRALGLLEEDTITWWWIGSHAEYDHMLKGRAV